MVFEFISVPAVLSELCLFFVQFVIFKIIDIRKNQKQVDANGKTVGNNRPDVQYNDKDGVHHNVEFDNSYKNSDRHGETIKKNDPKSQIHLNILDK